MRRSTALFLIPLVMLHSIPVLAESEGAFEQAGKVDLRSVEEAMDVARQRMRDEGRKRAASPQPLRVRAGKGRPRVVVGPGSAAAPPPVAVSESAPVEAPVAPALPGRTPPARTLSERAPAIPAVPEPEPVPPAVPMAKPAPPVAPAVIASPASDPPLDGLPESSPGEASMPELLPSSEHGPARIVPLPPPAPIARTTPQPEPVEPADREPPALPKAAPMVVVTPRLTNALPTPDPDAAKAELARAEKAKAEAAKAELARAEKAKAELARAEKAKAEAVKAELARAEKAKADAAKAELARAEKAKADAAKAKLARVESKSAEAAKREALPAPEAEDPDRVAALARSRLLDEADGADAGEAAPERTPRVSDTGLPGPVASPTALPAVAAAPASPRKSASTPVKSSGRTASRMRPSSAAARPPASRGAPGAGDTAVGGVAPGLADAGARSQAMAPAALPAPEPGRAPDATGAPLAPPAQDPVRRGADRAQQRARAEQAHVRAVRDVGQLLRAAQRLPERSPGRRLAAMQAVEDVARVDALGASAQEHLRRGDTAGAIAQYEAASALAVRARGALESGPRDDAAGEAHSTGQSEPSRAARANGDSPVATPLIEEGSPASIVARPRRWVEPYGAPLVGPRKVEEDGPRDVQGLAVPPGPADELAEIRSKVESLDRTLGQVRRTADGDPKARSKLDDAQAELDEAHTAVAERSPLIAEVSLSRADSQVRAAVRRLAVRR